LRGFVDAYFCLCFDETKLSQIHYKSGKRWMMLWKWHWFVVVFILEIAWCHQQLVTVELHRVEDIECGVVLLLVSVHFSFPDF